MLCCAANKPIVCQICLFAFSLQKSRIHIALLLLNDRLVMRLKSIDHRVFFVVVVVWTSSSSNNSGNTQTFSNTSLRISSHTIYRSIDRHTAHICANLFFFFIFVFTRLFFFLLNLIIIYLRFWTLLTATPHADHFSSYFWCVRLDFRFFTSTSFAFTIFVHWISRWNRTRERTFAHTRTHSTEYTVCTDKMRLNKNGVCRIEI